MRHTPGCAARGGERVQATDLLDREQRPRVAVGVRALRPDPGGRGREAARDDVRVERVAAQGDPAVDQRDHLGSRERRPGDRERPVDLVPAKPRRLACDGGPRRERIDLGDERLNVHGDPNSAPCGQSAAPYDAPSGMLDR
jgi:hypothetical protein